MTAATTAHQPLRIVSRRAQLLLQRHREQNGLSTPAAKKTTPKKEDDTPWPKSLRYTFYTLCAVAVPMSIGQAIALSPRLREKLSGDDVECDTSSSTPTKSSGGSSGLSSSRGIISLVRNYWGHEDYLPPVDRPQLKHTEPGHRKKYQEDNYSSLLQLFGLYTTKDEEQSSSSHRANGKVEEEVPLSLDNEPPSYIRNDQKILSQYLSTKCNPSGVKTRLTLLPSNYFNADGNLIDTEDIDNTAGYDTECTLPANITLKTLREHCLGSDAQCVKRDLAEKFDPTFHSKSTTERLRTIHWNEDCRWVVSFADDEEEEDSKEDTYNTSEEKMFSISVLGNDTAQDAEMKHSKPTDQASRELRHLTAINSSWTYFPDSAMNNSVTSPTAMGSAAVSSSPSAPTSVTVNTTDNSLRVQRLQYQIATLENDLKDSSSMRDRDDMAEELRLAKRELRSLKPWYKRFWG